MSIISEVKERIDIVSYISEYVQLTRAGRNYRGLCPFHSEKHGSFFVFPERQTWRCFGACGTGGDIFSFVMKKENVDFKEALMMLAERAGVRLDSPKPRDDAEEDAKARLLACVNLAVEYYHNLLVNADSGATALRYVTSRHITRDTVDAYRLGYSPDSWRAFKDFALSHGFSESELVAAGLLVSKDDGSTYDRFRGRLMFPILDKKGTAIGFGARALGDFQPKYMNSPQSVVFDKSSVLYGIHRAATAARRADHIVIVEGYMDVLQAHQHGWENVVAPMGTSLTEKQAREISRLTKKVYLALDADTAGIASVMKTIRETTGRFRESFGHRTVTDVPSRTGLASRTVLDADIRVIVMPAGRDPDEVIASDPAQWKTLVEQAIPHVDFYVETLLQSMDTATSLGKRELIAQCEPLLDEIGDSIEQARFYSRMSHALGISERDLQAEVLAARKQRQQSEKRAVNQAKRRRRFAGVATEEYCLCLLLHDHALLEANNNGLSEDLFESTENAQIYKALLQVRDIEAIRSVLDASLNEHLDYLLSVPFPPGIPDDEETRQLAFNDCVLHLQERLAKRQQFMLETILSRERDEDGVEAELAALERAGVESGQQLQDIFTRRSRRRGITRG
ncbi:MAG TPA: DNA primase [Dehalococcoidia bacterium]|nr:DNA primase [Dehalococcoidia bacterium]